MSQNFVTFIEGEAVIVKYFQIKCIPAYSSVKSMKTVIIILTKYLLKSQQIW